MRGYNSTILNNISGGVDVTPVQVSDIRYQEPVFVSIDYLYRIGVST